MERLQGVFTWLKSEFSESQREKWSESWREVDSGNIVATLSPAEDRLLCLDFLYILGRSKKWLNSKLLRVVICDQIVAEYRVNSDAAQAIVNKAFHCWSTVFKSKWDYTVGGQWDLGFLKFFFVEVMASRKPETVVADFGCGAILLRHLQGTVDDGLNAELISLAGQYFKGFIEEMSVSEDHESAWVAKQWLSFRLIPTDQSLPVPGQLQEEIEALLLIEQDRIGLVNYKVTQELGHVLEKSGLVYCVDIIKRKGIVEKKWELTSQARWHTGGIFVVSNLLITKGDTFSKLSGDWQLRFIEMCEVSRLEELIAGGGFMPKLETIEVLFSKIHAYNGLNSATRILQNLREQDVTPKVSESIGKCLTKKVSHGTL